MQIFISKKPLKRLKVVLVEFSNTNKWLTEQIIKNETTISLWCTNEVQPSIETLSENEILLDIDIID